MLSLIKTEFMKLKRKKIVLLSMLTALFFPILWTMLSLRDNLSYSVIFKDTTTYIMLIFLPCILVIIATILFYSESEHDTLKNLLMIPVKRSRLIIAKLSVVLLLSITYMLITFLTGVIGGLLVGGVENIIQKLAVSTFVGVMDFIAILPILFLVITSNKGYIFATVSSFVYAFLSFAFIQTRIILPLNAVYRLVEPYFGIDLSYWPANWKTSDVTSMSILLASGLIFLFASIWIYNRKDI